MTIHVGYYMSYAQVKGVLKVRDTIRAEPKADLWASV